MFVTLDQLADQLRLPQGWLSEEVSAGRIPHFFIHDVPYFSLPVVVEVLEARLRAKAMPVEAPATKDSLLAKPIESLPMSQRAKNCLTDSGVHTIGDLVLLSRRQLLVRRALGAVSLNEIIVALAQHNLALAAG